MCGPLTWTAMATRIWSSPSLAGIARARWRSCGIAGFRTVSRNSNWRPSTPTQRHIHVPTCDLDGDGRLDFVASVSQHQETVFAFLNRGEGKIEKQKLWSAEDPSFGSSGLELVDLDDDGDLDVLGTCGDTFDNKHVKPYHGVYWLENRGALRIPAPRVGVRPRRLSRTRGGHRFGRGQGCGCRGLLAA